MATELEKKDFQRLSNFTVAFIHSFEFNFTILYCEPY